MKKPLSRAAGRGPPRGTSAAARRWRAGRSARCAAGRGRTCGSPAAHRGREAAAHLLRDDAAEAEVREPRAGVAAGGVGRRGVAIVDGGLGQRRDDPRGGGRPSRRRARGHPLRSSGAGRSSYRGPASTRAHARAPRPPPPEDPAMPFAARTRDDPTPRLAPLPTLVVGARRTRLRCRAAGASRARCVVGWTRGTAPTSPGAPTTGRLGLGRHAQRHHRRAWAPRSPCRRRAFILELVTRPRTAGRVYPRCWTRSCGPRRASRALLDRVRARNHASGAGIRRRLRRAGRALVRRRGRGRRAARVLPACECSSRRACSGCPRRRPRSRRAGGACARGAGRWRARRAVRVRLRSARSGCAA